MAGLCVHALVCSPGSLMMLTAIRRASLEPSDQCDGAVREQFI